MIPRVINEELVLDFEEEVQPSRTYRIDQEKQRLIGYTDDIEAVAQAIYKALSTERYDCIIYTWNYGAELSKLFGKPIPFVYSELKRLTSEALSQDDRITKCDNFEFSHKKNKVSMSFTAHTSFGELPIEGVEVDI